jgi:hypothetical protein
VSIELRDEFADIDAQAFPRSVSDAKVSNRRAVTEAAGMTILQRFLS